MLKNLAVYKAYKGRLPPTRRSETVNITKDDTTLQRIAKMSLCCKVISPFVECQRWLAMTKASVCLSVFLSVKRVHCDKTEERYVRIFIALAHLARNIDQTSQLHFFRPMTPTAQICDDWWTPLIIRFRESYNSMSMSRKSTSLIKSSGDWLKLAKQWYSIWVKLCYFWTTVPEDQMWTRCPPVDIETSHVDF